MHIEKVPEQCRKCEHALLEALEQSIKNEQEQVDPRIEALNGIFGMLSPDEAKEIRENKVIFRGGL